MKKWIKNIPDGTSDILFSRCTAKRDIEKKIEGYFEGLGFCEIITPSIEFFDVFYSPEIFEAENMYKLFDNSNRLLALRADCTTPVARVVATRLKNYPSLLRLFYKQNVFRLNADFAGKRNEITQCGAELIGVKGIKADTDIIATAMGALKAGIKDSFKIEIGHTGLFKALAVKSNMSSDDIEAARKLIESKNLTALKAFLSEFGDNALPLLQLPKMFGGREILSRAREIFEGEDVLNIISYIEELYDRLKELGLTDNILIDLGLVSSIDYYTGIVFRGYAEGSGSTVLTGGRYDQLIAKFGEDRPAAGFAIDVDALSDTVKAADENIPDYLLHYENGFEKNAYEALEKLKLDGYICEMSVFDSADEAKDYADKKGIKNVIMFPAEAKQL